MSIDAQGTRGRVDARLTDIYIEPNDTVAAKEGIVICGRCTKAIPQHSCPDAKPPMRSSEITKDNLRVGDVIVNGDYFVSRVKFIADEYFMIDTVNSPHIIVSIIYFENVGNWRIKLPASEQPKQQLTHKQIEEKLGYEIEIIKE